MTFDLDAYLARIRLPVRVTQDAEGLTRLQRAHRQAIPFENLDVILGRGIAIDNDSVFAKLVTAKRGGYCFEQNRLFLDALMALGFAARPLLARVWLGTDAPQRLTHALALVTIDGEDWIADSGFGGSDAPPMRLKDGEEVSSPDGARYRLDYDEAHGWMLSRDGAPGGTDGREMGEGWIRQYSLTLAEVSDADLAAANEWTSTAPESRFCKLRIASLVLPNGFASLTDRHYRRRAGGDETSSEITDPRVYRMRMSLMFGIDLTKEEVDGLGLFPAEA